MNSLRFIGLSKWQTQSVISDNSGCYKLLGVHHSCHSPCFWLKEQMTNFTHGVKFTSYKKYNQSCQISCLMLLWRGLFKREMHEPWWPSNWVQPWVWVTRVNQKLEDRQFTFSSPTPSSERVSSSFWLTSCGNCTVQYLLGITSPDSLTFVALILTFL